MSDDMLDSFTKPLIGKYPNTYTFTKALAESMLEEHAKDLPLLIVRPSIVCASIEDPMPVSCAPSNLHNLFIKDEKLKFLTNS